MIKTSVAHWKSFVESAQSKLENELAGLQVPIIRGHFATEPTNCISIEELDFLAISSLLTPGSLCAIDLRIPPAPIQKDLTLRDLHIYLRLGESQTWLHHSIETPEYDDPDDIPEDEIDHQWRRPFFISDKELPD